MNKSSLLREIIRLQKIRAERAKKIIGITIQNPMKARNFYQQLLDSNESYIRYQVTNTELDLYFVAYHTKSPYSLEEFISLIPYFSDNALPSEYYLEQILSIFSFFKSKKDEEIRVKLFQHERDKISVFNEVGFHPFSYSMIGLIDDSLKHISENVDVTSFDIRRLSFNTEYKEIIEPLFHNSFEFEADNWEFPYNKAYKDFLRKREAKIALMKDEGVQLIAFVDGKIAGYISSYIDRGDLFPEDLGVIFEMVIHPDFQTSNARLALYNESLKFFKDKGLDYFYGTSGSKSVLAVANKMNRKVYSISLRLPYSKDLAKD